MSRINTPEMIDRRHRRQVGGYWPTRFYSDQNGLRAQTFLSDNCLAYIITLSINNKVDFNLSRLLRNSCIFGCRKGHFSRSSAAKVVTLLSSFCGPSLDMFLFSALSMD